MMKSISLIAAFMVFLAGCRHSTEPSSAQDMYVNFEIEQAFQNDSVLLVLDGQPLVQTRVTTNYSVDLAWASGFRKISRTRHTLTFTVAEYGAQKVYVLDTSNDSSSVMLAFDKATKQISITQIKGRLLRD